MDKQIIPRIISLLIAIVCGNIVITVFLRVIRRWIKCDNTTYDAYKKAYYAVKSPLVSGYEAKVPSWLQGLIEQLFFTVLVALKVPGYPTAMIAWLAVKMLTNLNRPGHLEGEIVTARAITGLMGALLSMLLALFCGLVMQAP